MVLVPWLAIACHVEPKPLIVTLPGSDDRAVSTAPLPIDASAVTFQFQHLREVPYDGFSLPLISPDGSAAAIQLSSSIGWEAKLAGRSGQVSSEGTVAIASLVMPCADPLIPVPGNDMILGRSCDSAGFLVESARLDGSRWIGKVRWDSGAREWLVRDESVNAFATLGPSGELAWSWRPLTGKDFSVVIRRARGESIIEAREGASWYAPTFSSDGELLFVLQLRDGVLSLCAFSLSGGQDPALVSQVVLSMRADRQMAYQTIVPLRNAATAPQGSIQFFHPQQGRIAYWRCGSSNCALTAPGTVAAMPIGDTRLLTATARTTATESQPPDGQATASASRNELTAAAWIPIGVQFGSVVVAHPSSTNIQLGLLKFRP